MHSFIFKINKRINVFYIYAVCQAVAIVYLDPVINVLCFMLRSIGLGNWYLRVFQ